MSLYLDGMERGTNHNARSRYIVMHGADYVSEEFIDENGRLGRSFGCPAVSRELEEEIIYTLAEGTCLFSYFPDSKYLSDSRLLDTEGLFALNQRL